MLSRHVEDPFEHTESLTIGASYRPQDAAKQLLIPSLPNHREGTYYLFFYTDADNSLYELKSCLCSYNLG